MYGQRLEASELKLFRRGWYIEFPNLDGILSLNLRKHYFLGHPVSISADQPLIIADTDTPVFSSTPPCRAEPSRGADSVLVIRDHP